MTDNVQSVERAFTLFELLANHNILSLSQLCGQTGLHKTTVYRLLSTLIQLGYVDKADDSRYRLSMKVFELGSKRIQNTDFYNTARSFMRRLALSLEQTVHMVIEDNNEILYIDKITVNETGLKMQSKIGLKAPMYCTAVGKALLAVKTDSEIERYWNAVHKKKFTDKTVQTYEDLLKDIRAVRRRGYALDIGEYEKDIICIGSSFATYQNRGAGAFSTSLGVNAIQKLDTFIPLILDTAKQLTEVLGGA